MRTRLAHRWAVLRTSFWFLPGLMVVAAVVLAAIAVGIDVALAGTELPPWVYTG